MRPLTLGSPSKKMPRERNYAYGLPMVLRNKAPKNRRGRLSSTLPLLPIPGEEDSRDRKIRPGEVFFIDSGTSKALTTVLLGSLFHTPGSISTEEERFVIVLPGFHPKGQLFRRTKSPQTNQREVKIAPKNELHPEVQRSIVNTVKDPGSRIVIKVTKAGTIICSGKSSLEKPAQKMEAALKKAVGERNHATAKAEMFKAVTENV